MKTEQLERLFNNYLAAFSAYDLDAVIACYQLPCTLHTPDKVVLLNNIAECRQEFTEIFTQLKQAKTAEIIARKASYQSIAEDLLLVCVDWDFIDDKKEVIVNQRSKSNQPTELAGLGI